MTGQIPDAMRYAGEDYSLVGVNGGPLFEPATYGLTAGVLSTACWRGYVATYGLSGDRLILSDLEIGLLDEDRNYIPVAGAPPLFGTPPSASDHIATAPFYRGLAEPIAFTGELLLGRDFVDDLYVHMGFQDAWKYREVHRLTFETGRLVSAADQSAEAARHRADPPPPPPNPHDRQAVEDWIKGTFDQRFDPPA